MLVNNETIITPSFFLNDVLWVAPNLVGKYIVRHFPNGQINRYKITETEAYRGEEDLACHARKGKTTRTEVMYWEGGFIYVYLIYGMHYMLNVVTSTANNPQAVLIRCTEHAQGPGRVTKLLQIDNGYNKKHITNLPDLWFEDNPDKFEIKTAPRVGIDYAGELWKNKPWRFIAD